MLGVAYERYSSALTAVEPGYWLCPSPDVPCPNPTRTRKVACHLAVGKGLEQCPHRRGFGPQPAHYRGLVGPLSPAWSRQPGLRADWWFPPVLNSEQQEQLKSAVQAPPSSAGLGLANWNWKVVREFLGQRFGCWLCRSSCLITRRAEFHGFYPWVNENS